MCEAKLSTLQVSLLPGQLTLKCWKGLRTRLTLLVVQLYATYAIPDHTNSLLLSEYEVKYETSDGKYDANC